MCVCMCVWCGWFLVISPGVDIPRGSADDQKKEDPPCYQFIPGEECLQKKDRSPPRGYDGVDYGVEAVDDALVLCFGEHG